MDSGLLEVSKKWDGYPDYVVIPFFVKAVQDGGKITETEYNTLKHIFDTKYSKSALFMSVCEIIYFQMDKKEKAS